MNKSINEVAIAERRAYYRAWRAKNRDKVKASNRRYWLKRAEKVMNEKNTREGKTVE